MSFDPKLTITGLQEAQRDNLQMIAHMRPDNALGRMVQDVGVALHRYKVSIADVDTGANRAAQQMQMASGGRVMVLGIAPGAVNPRTGQRPAEYGFYENRRGGEHAFNDRTVDEKAEDAVTTAGRRFLGSMP